MKENKKYCDFYSEYIDVIDIILNELMDSCKKINSNVFTINNVSLEKVVKNELWVFIFFRFREIYNLKRKQKTSITELKVDILKQLSLLLPNEDETIHLNNNLSNNLELKNKLKGIENSICIYCYNLRQFKYLLPLILNIKESTVIFTSFNIEDISFENKYVTVLQFEYLNIKPYYNNSYLLRCFPKLYWFINLFYFFFKNISPRSIILLEGCHSEMEVLSSLAKLFEIPSICLQQGWPSILHTRFKNMTYDYYLTWGNNFNNLWLKYNQSIKFIETGYIFPIEENHGKDNVITFFLQAPYIILDHKTFDMLLEFAVWCAVSFPSYQILIKEHPEYELKEKWLKIFLNYHNVTVIKNEKLESIFQRTKISVSVFSSTLMEGIAHDVIPFVFNITSFDFYPNYLDKRKIGIIANSIKEAKLKMSFFMHNIDYQNELINSILSTKYQFYDSLGVKSIEKTNNIIQQLSL